MLNPFNETGHLCPEAFDQIADSWQHRTTQPQAEGHRDAFIGNGLIGVRVPVEGEPSIYPARQFERMAPSGALMYGIWGIDGLAPVFNFMALELACGDRRFQRGETWRDYSQELDWRNATLTTRCSWILPQGKVHVETIIFLSRDEPHLGVIKTALTADADIDLTLTDIVDAHALAFMPPGETYPEPARAHPIRTFFTYVGSQRQLLAASTMLSVECNDWREDIHADERGFRRACHLRLRAGERASVTKFAALAGNSQVPDPITFTRTQVAGAWRAPQRIRERHEQAWRDFWKRDIEVSHPGLQTLVRAALYAFGCTLRPGLRFAPGPTGLSANAWFGRVFWDDDLWMFPPVALLHPELGRNFVDYRFDTLPGARRNARAQQLDGAQFPWESAATGDETIPDLIYSQQRHVNSDVAMAVYQYYLISGDETCWQTQGREIILENARFWASRVTHNPALDRYEIHAVCCADENAEIRDNNAFTNYGAAWSLRLALTEFPDAADPRWRDIADKLWIPQDPATGRIIEHDTYNGELIKQADATLLIYPCAMPLDTAAKQATVDYYSQKYPADAIMMGAAIDAIVQAELNRPDKAWANLLKTLPHFRAPFFQATESPGNEVAVFLTGLGGLLQAILMGFGGLRLERNELRVTPHLPPGLDYIRCRGLCYHGERFDLLIERDNVQRIPLES